MSPKTTSVSNGNRVLASLLKSDIELLQPDLESRAFAVHHVFEEPNKPIRYVHFLDAGVASVVTSIGNGKDIEIGIIGREGVTGGAVAMGNDRSPHKTYIQIAGRGQRITAEKFRRALRDSDSFRSVVMKSVSAFHVQTAHTAAANARATIEQRLARWLLMADDRVDGNELPLTHEFLALMLAVRRSGVTVAVQSLVQRGHIRAARGRITILDRAALEEIAGSFYGVPEGELRRLLGERPRAL